MYQRLQEPKLLCPVCQQIQKELFPVASCPHRFCRYCATTYISSQASNFSAAKCLQEGCGAPLDKSLPVYDLLSPNVKHKLKQFEAFIFLQQHPNFASCKATDCIGLFELKLGKCNTCGSIHCKRCANILHEGPCIQSEQQKQMVRMNFRKCPKCRIWVQKVQGCRFISCKCGVQFCFTCGHEFSKDPCRKQQIWKNQLDIKELFKKLQWQRPFTIGKIASYLFKSMLGFLVVILLSMFFTVCIIFALFLGIAISVFVPLAFCKQITRSRSNECQYCGCILIAIFYPLLVATVMILWVSIILLYPFCRNNNHHGIYDPFDIGLSYITIIFLKILARIVK